MRIKREPVYLTPLLVCSTPSLILNRTDIHMDINKRYRDFSEKYWAGVLCRQRAYLASRRLERLLQVPLAIIEKHPVAETKPAKAEVVRQERQERAVQTVGSVKAVETVTCLCTGF